MRDLRNQSERAGIEIDPEAFDDPRQLMWERLVEEYGQETIADLVRANLSQDLTAAGIQWVNALWDNRDGIQVDPSGVETPADPDQPGGEQDWPATTAERS